MMNAGRCLWLCLWLALSIAPFARSAEREVRFQSDGVLLAGTLTSPEAATKSPALLLVPGSGAVDRNGNGDGLNTDLYRHLAHQLAQVGFATLRYDKRGVGASKTPQKNEEAVTLSQVARDALAALHFLRQQPEVDPKRVGVLGYEDGALIGMALAGEVAAPPKVLVCLAPPGRTPAIILRENLQQRWRSEGLSADKVARRLGDFDTAIAALYYRLPMPPLHEEVAPYFMLPYRPYLQEFYFENPVARLKTVRVPVLLIYGEMDRRVSPKLDGELLLQHARNAGNSKVELKVISGTAHVFKSSPTGDTQEILTNPQLPLVPALVNVLKEWLTANL